MNSRCYINFLRSIWGDKIFDVISLLRNKNRSSQDEFLKVGFSVSGSQIKCRRTSILASAHSLGD